MQQRQLNDFAELFERFFATSNVVVCNIWFLLDCHHCDSGVDFRRKRNLDLVFGTINSTIWYGMMVVVVVVVVCRPIELETGMETMCTDDGRRG
jgi:hypothetical protein